MSSRLCWLIQSQELPPPHRHHHIFETPSHVTTVLNYHIQQNINKSNTMPAFEAILCSRHTSLIYSHLMHQPTFDSWIQYSGGAYVMSWFNTIPQNLADALKNLFTNFRELIESTIICPLFDVFRPSWFVKKATATIQKVACMEWWVTFIPPFYPSPHISSSLLLYIVCPKLIHPRVVVSPLLPSVCNSLNADPPNVGASFEQQINLPQHPASGQLDSAQSDSSLYSKYCVGYLYST